MNRATRARALLVTAALLAAGATPVVGPTAGASAATPAPTCQASTPGGPVFVTGSCVDPVLDQPYIDQDQPGTATDPTTGVTVHFRFIHGGFTGTAARFAFYFPSPGQYRGRFFETTYPTLSQEDMNPDCGEEG